MLSRRVAVHPKKINVKAADERNASHVDTFTQLQLPLKEEHTFKAVSSLVGPSQNGSQTAALKTGLKAKELEMQTLPGLAAENSTLRVEVSWLRSSVNTLGRERREELMLTHDVRDLTAKTEKI